MYRENLKLSFVIFLIILLALFTSTVFASSETEKLLQEIIEAKTMKPDVFAFINMGNFYCSLDLYEPAEKEYEKALSLDETNILARINQSYALYKIGEKESALAKLTQIIIEDSNNAFAYFVKGKIHKEALEYDLAINEYKKVAELIPQNDKLICELAQLYQDNGQFIKATETYTKLNKLKPSPYILDNFLAYQESAACYLNLGDYFSGVGNIDQAVSAYSKATQFTEDKRSIAIAHYRLGLISLKGEEYEQAIMEKVLSQKFYPLYIKDFTFDNFAQAFIEMGNMHYDAGELKKAHQNYELALQLADSNYILSEAHYKLGLSYYRSQDYENAVREGEIALSLNPEFLSDQQRSIDLLIANAWSNLTKINSEKIEISNKTEKDENKEKSTNESSSFSIISLSKETPTPKEEPKKGLVKSWVGTGIKTTEAFSITSTPWKVSYSGGGGSLAIYVYNINGDLESVFQSSDNKGDTSFVYKTGKFYLQITSMDKWKVEVLQ